MKLRKRVLAGLLSAVMAVSSLQLSTVPVLAEENSDVTQEAAVEIEEAEKEEKELAETEDLEQPDADNTQQSESEEPDDESENVIVPDDEESSVPASESDDEEDTDNGEAEDIIDEVTVTEDEAQLLADENADDIMPIAEGDIAGDVINEEYGNITWVIDGNGKLTVTGTGDFSDTTDYKRAPWYNNRNDITSAEIKVTDMTNASFMFYGCKNLITMDLSGFDTSKVTNMQRMFYGCEQLLIVDLSSLDTSKVTNMQSMFEDCKALSSIDLSGNFDTSQVTDMRYMFRDCQLLGSIDLSGFDTGNLKYMNRMFDECRALSSIDLSSFDTSLITDMSELFAHCYALSSVDLSGSFDTSNVTNMGSMFSSCKALSSIDLSSLNTSNVTSMGAMFFNCEMLTSIDLSGSFDTSHVTSMVSMFRNCKALSSIDLSSFNTSQVTDMSYMFYSCENLSSIDLSSFNTSQVTDMSYMFEYCGKLSSIDLSGFDTSNVETMSSKYTFYGCVDLSTIYTPRNLKLSVLLPQETWYKPDGTVITEFPQELSYSIVITKDSIPEKGPYITAYKSKTVYECGDEINLVDLRVRYIDESGKVTAVTSGYSTNASQIDMSEEGTKTLIITYNELTYEIELTVTKKETEEPEPEEPAASYITATKTKTVYECGEELTLDDLIVVCHDEEGKITIVTEYDTNADEINMSEEGTKTLIITYNELTYEIELIVYIAVEGIAGGVIDEAYGHIIWVIDDNGKLTVTGTGDFPSYVYALPWYDYREDIKSAEIKVTKMTYAADMFWGCKNLISADLSGFDTSQVTNMSWMFYNCESLSSIIGLSRFDTSQVTTMQSMFHGCKSLSSIDVSSFDTSRVTTMLSMFNGCEMLSSIDVSSFKTGQVTNISGMFRDCKSLNSIDLSGFDTSKVTYMGNVFNGCSNLQSVNLSSCDTSRVNTGSMNNIFLDCNTLSVIYAPLKLNQSVPLPEGTWYDPEGTVITELPRGLDYSITITKDRRIGEPYITATKTKTVYECGDELNLDDITVEYHDAEENITYVTEYGTNADTINMRIEGTKTLIITYNDAINELKCKITLTVIKKSGSEDSQDPDNETGFHIHFVNEEDKESVYTGAAIKPAIEVTYNGYELTEGIDYTVKYSNNVKASGNAKVTVTGKGSYTGKTSETFTINKQSISDFNVEITGVELDGNGNMVLDSAGTPTLLVVEKTKASPVLTYYGAKLASKEFTVEGNQKWTGNGVVTIKANDTGNFSGERKLNIKVISKKDLKKFTVTVDKSVTYDGDEHKLIPVVTDSKTKENLAKTDYTVTYSKDVTNAGTVKVTVAGRGYYTGSVTKSYKIKPITAPATDMEVELSNKAGYTFKPNGVILKKDDITVKYKGKTEPLVYGTDYKVTCSGNKKVGDNAKYKVTFIGNYKGSKAVSGNFTINKAILNDENDGLKISVPDKVYTGKPGIYKSAPYVSINGVSLKSSDYTVTYWADRARNANEIIGKENNITVTDEPVTVYVKIAAKGNNYETPNNTYAAAEYKVYPKPSDSRYDLSKAKITLTFKDKDGNIVKKPEFIGDDIEVMPAAIKVECKSDKKWVTVPDDKYTVEYANNVYKGKAIALIKSNSTEYAGSKAVKFSIGAYNLNILRIFL